MEKYIEKLAAGQLSEKERYGLERRLDERTAAVEGGLRKRGKVDRETSKYRLRYTYGPAPYNEHMHDFKRAGGWDDEPIEDEYRELTGFRFTGKKGEAFDLRDLLPAEWKAYFNHRLPYHYGAEADPDGRAVIVAGDIGRATSLLALAHEAAHARRLEAMNKTERRTFRSMRRAFHDAVRGKRAVSEQIVADVLKDEGAAWGAALKALKPVFDAGFMDRKDAITYIHHVMLAAYSEEIARLVERGLVEEQGGDRTGG